MFFILDHIVNLIGHYVSFDKHVDMVYHFPIIGHDSIG